MIQFILNDQLVSTALPPGTLLLDYVRYHQHLTGTKIGCREGDCGACTTLIGELKNGILVYRSVTSCLMALGNVQGKHVVTIEGINLQGLNYIQQAFANEGATQCGYCTPGFIVSLAGHCLQPGSPQFNDAIDAVNGNICRCTGYKSIERAIDSIAHKLNERGATDPIAFAVAEGILPAYFKDISDRLVNLLPKLSGIHSSDTAAKILGGGTDLYVQQHDTMPHANIQFLADQANLKGIENRDGICYLGAAVTVTDMAQSTIFKQHFPDLEAHIKLVSSTPIRNMATIAGNFVNASPIGDFTIFFLALDTKLVIQNEHGDQRVVPLRSFYKGYKQLDKLPSEQVVQVYFNLPTANTQFNFEKVCKRTHLDIASVNTAVLFQMEGDTIQAGSLSAGGVGPTPAYLPNASALLTGATPSVGLFEAVIAAAQEEISPISDARGTATYKRLLLAQLMTAHFVKAFPTVMEQWEVA